MTPITSRAEARHLVEAIATSKGYISLAHREGLAEVNVELQQVHENALQQLREELGSPVKTLAKDLYSSTERFIYELLQNCEDNHYENAMGRGEEPYVLFLVYPDRIVLECNEDGFTEKNLVAICKVGQSSKTNSQLYIGEKGIGFKSVFTVAFQAIIQSGHFSFSFTHREGDSGMGMTTPVWEDALDPAEAGKTRITLRLHADDTSNAGLKRVIGQFESIHEEMLLFTRKIKRIEVKTYDLNEQLQHSCCYSRQALGQHLVCTRTLEIRSDNSSTLSEKRFHVASFKATGLPRRDVDREVTNGAPVFPSSETSEILLAFPLSESSTPLLKNQWLFSFLPVTQTGFKFIIQADFVTSASRESIDTTSKRNQAIMEQIPAAFIKAMQQMCEHDILRYRWMRYIPFPGEGVISGPLWDPIIQEIRACIRKTPLIRPAKGGDLRLIDEMRRLCAEDVDKDGSPLLEDVVPEQHVSRMYKDEDLKSLRDLGLINLDMNDTIIRVKQDLKLPSSRLKSSTSEDWHSRVAKLLQMPFYEGWKDCEKDLLELDLLPLRQGRWASSKADAVYFAEVDDLTIPANLKLRVVDDDAAKNAERRKLFELLGVQTTPISLVRQLIYKRYGGNRPRRTPVRTSIQDLHFLYLTQDSVDEIETKNPFQLKMDDGRSIDPGLQDVYLVSDDPLEPSRLLAPTPLGYGLDDNEAPGYSVPYLDESYLRNAPTYAPGTLSSWRDWLHDTMLIRRNVPLTDETGEALSDICIYVSRHRPAIFLHLVKRLWEEVKEEVGDAEEEEGGISQYAGAIEQLMDMSVLCRGDRYFPLHMTFLPTSSSEKIANRFLADGDPFLWVSLESPLIPPCPIQEWESLAASLQFGLPDSDLEFGLSILGYLVDSSDDPPEGIHSLLEADIFSHGHARVHDLYVFLEARVRGSDDVDSAECRVRKFIKDGSMIFIPSYGVIHDACWVGPGSCVWQAPIDKVRAVLPLSRLYSKRTDRQAGISTLDGLEHFFCHILEVPEWSWKHAVAEIELQMEYRDGPDFDFVIALYANLLELSSSEEDAISIRLAFESKALVYEPGGGWHKSNDCLWTSATDIPGKTTINNYSEYDSLEAFFLNVIGIQTMTAQMLFAKLVTADGSTSTEQLKGDLLGFSAILPDAKKEDFLNSLSSSTLLEAQIFPVRKPDGDVVRVTGAEPFSISDRAPFAACFRDKARMLDFETNQVRRLDNLIQWLGLQNRYLSTSVREIPIADMESARPISESQRQIRKKAGSLLRVAISYGSPRVASDCMDLYQMLRGCETLETTGIITTLTLHQLGGDAEGIIHEKEGGISLCIQDQEEGLKVFVPRKKADREACFQSKLPRHLLEWIMQDPRKHFLVYPGGRQEPSAEMVRLVQAVLSAHTCALKSILEEYGIPEIEAQFDDPVDEEDGPADVDGRGRRSSDLPSQRNLHPDNANIPATGPNADPIRPGRRNRRSRRRSSRAEADTDTVPQAQPSPDANPASQTGSPVGHTGGTAVISVTPAPSAPPVIFGGSQGSDNPPSDFVFSSREPSPNWPPFPRPSSTTPYLHLLERVVARARRLQFPSRGTFDMSAMGDALPRETDEGIVIGLPFLREFDKLERDKMVGAAGELFVYELLYGLQPSLPGFQRSNWQSNIRGYVNIHPDYSTLFQWSGSETADITYRDTTGALTSFLADKGYLEQYNVERLRQANPLYYFEVKTTLYPYQTTFFMSTRQYERVGRRISYWRRQRLTESQMQDYSQSVDGQEENLGRIYVIMRVFNLDKDSASVRVLVDPEGMRRRDELNFEAEGWKVRGRNIPNL